MMSITDLSTDYSTELNVLYNIPEQEQPIRQETDGSAQTTKFVSGKEHLASKEYSVPAYMSTGDELFVLTPQLLKKQMLSSAMKVKVAPMLLINGGLPSSSKTTALKKLLEKAKLSSSVLKETDGIAFCDMLAARNLLENTIVYVPPVREKGYPTVMYAGVENTIRSMGKRLNVVVLPSDNFSGFKNEDLNGHLKNVMNDLHKAHHAKCRKFTEWDESHTCGLALINVWDLGLNKISTYVLSHLAGHLYNSHVWLFLDLLRDADHLYEVPNIPDNRYDKSRNDKELIMRWRSRIRYLLRFAKLASKKNGSRQNVSNIVTSYTGSEEIKGHMIKLKETVETVSKQLELQDLINTEDIKAFHHQNIEPLYQLFEKIIRDGLDNTDEIPLSFVFLRGMFYDKDHLYIQKDELREISKELNIDDKDFEWFCHLFTSFGSIIDVSLIDHTSNLIILKPVQFLNTFDKLFYYSPSGTIVTSHGLVSKATSEEIFGNDAHVFMSFLKSLRIATEISPEQVNIPTEQRSYYVPNICTSPPLLQCNPTSLHLVHDMNISLSHFKVSFTTKFLNSYPEAQLNVTMTPHINITRFCSPSISLLVELVYHGDIIEFRFPPDLDEKLLHDVCECIVCICHDIMDQNDILYDFAIMCPKDVSQACKLQTHRHSLPLEKEDCKKCSCSENTASVTIFNSVLKEHKIDEKKVLNGEFSSEDVAIMSKKLATLSTEVAKKVYHEFSEESSSTSASDKEEERSLPSDEDLRNWRTFMSMILAWEARNKKHAKRECALKLKAIAEKLGDKSADADKLMELYRSFIKGSYQQKGST